MDYPDAKSIYEDLREKWTHEDSLINQRVTWLLSSQALALTIYGYIAKFNMEFNWAEYSVLQKITSPTYLAELAIPILTLYVLHFLKDAVIAAVNAMALLKEALHKHQAEGKLDASLRVDVLDFTTERGAKAPRHMTTAFQSIWVLLLFFEVFSILRVISCS